MTNGNHNAMPTDIWCKSRNGGFYQEGTDPGLTKREYMAAHIFAGVWSMGKVDTELLVNHQQYANHQLAAKFAVNAADALIEALNAEVK